MQKCGVLVLDDHPIISLGVETLLKDEKQFQFLGAATTVIEGQSLTRALRPDLIVLDLMLSGRNRLDIIPDLLTLSPKSRIVVYSSLDEHQYAHLAFAAGSSGYVPKNEGLITLLAALRSAFEDKRGAGESDHKAFFTDTAKRKANKQPVKLDGLSQREFSVFRLLGFKFKSTEIAAQLGVSVKTVNTYRERIKNKLGFEDALELKNGAETIFRAQSPNTNPELRWKAGGELSLAPRPSFSQRPQQRNSTSWRNRADAGHLANPLQRLQPKGQPKKVQAQPGT